jgi:hypothetical protein
MEVLAAFVRDRMRYTTIIARLSERAYFLWLQAGRPESRSEEFWVGAIRLEGLQRTPTDINAILTVIKRRSAENRQREVERGWHFDLSGTYLRSISFWGVYLERADLAGAHLEGADLVGAHLEGAFLVGAHLEGAFLVGAHLEGAFLMQAHLEGAVLVAAHLEGADLRQAHLKGAHLTETHLEGADLSTAEGLTHDQLASAYGDGKTKLSEGIRPKSWPLLVVEANAPLHFSTA